MNGNTNHIRRNELTISDIQGQIKNNKYKSKDELADYILDLRAKGLINIDNRQIKQLLDLFDNLHQKTDTALDMSNHSAISLENEDIIISQNQDRVLTTLEGTTGYKDEFKSTQNEIISNNGEKNVSAEQVFNKMAEQEKEELTLATLEQALTYPNINAELLMKIKFFITNIKENLNIFRINLETGMLYNMENNEPYEVRKNETTQEYEIYRGNEKIYGSNQIAEQEHIEPPQEELANENTLNNPKTRKLVPQQPTNYNAAFTKIGFLMMSIVTFVLLTLMTLLLMK